MKISVIHIKSLKHFLDISKLLVCFFLHIQNKFNFILKISYKNLKNFIRDGKGVYTPSQAMTIAACIYHLVRDVFLKLGTDIYFSGQVFPQMRVNEERLKQDIIENLDLTPEQIEKVKKISYFKNSLIELSRLDSMY